MKKANVPHRLARLRTDHDPKAFALAFVNTYDPVRPVVDLFTHPEHARVFLSQWCEMDWDLDWGRLARRLQLFRDRLRGALMRFLAGQLELHDFANELDRKLMHYPWVAHPQAHQHSLRVVFAPSPQLQPAQHVEALVTRGFADLIAELGAHRLRRCESPPCEEIFADRSKSGRQRFCGKRCATRFNVAAFRRRKAK